MLIAVIVACEVMFWVFLITGLTTRYLLRRPRAGAVLLVCAPLVDLVLLAATVIDLRSGAVATFAHGLAAIYLGASVGFGHRMIAWADVRFAHRFAGGPAPAPAPKTGRAHAAAERAAWLRHLLAWAVGCGLAGLAIPVVGDAARTEAFRQVISVWSVVLLIDFVIAFSYTIKPRQTHRPITDWL